MSTFTADLPAPHGFFTRDVTRETIDLGPFPVLGAQQVHGAKAVVATAPWAVPPEADAIVTATPGLVISVVTADCAPVLFATPDGTLVGAAHAGWRGAVGGILEATAASLAALGARDLRAAIGPCIHQQSYEVGPDLRDAVLAASAGAARFFTPGTGDRHFFDLPGYCAARLATAGIQAAILAQDTFTQASLFHSFRRRTKQQQAGNGHQVSAIRCAG